MEGGRGRGEQRDKEEERRGGREERRGEEGGRREEEVGGSRTHLALWEQRPRWRTEEHARWNQTEK